MVITSTDIKGLKKFISGKVRDVYDLGDELLIVATDRLSAFDVIMPTGIPDKGRVLTQLSLFWFDLTRDVVENHLITADTDEILKRLASLGIEYDGLRETLDGRSMITRKAKTFPVECVVRGYISGSAWNEYKSLPASSKGKIVLHGIELPGDLVESDKLPEPIFTPATKADLGGHDINISNAQMAEIIGDANAKALRENTLAVYRKASEYAASRGIIIADTKFEFGRVGDEIIIIDEVLTPDSSRFWDVNTYEPGGPQPSFDKQYVRDWLLSINFNKQPPGPELPDDVVRNTADKYREAYRRIVGESL
ncbi:MAG: phosphoribosylaminoimidazolesuccinocarboxamide synthase [Armatimonadetes bacterium]|nr:phosphoribosylaminoimidazolesuccinocarboxamide synthase [Armatimonadota bacterium]